MGSSDCGSVVGESEDVIWLVRASGAKWIPCWRRKGARQIVLIFYDINDMFTIMFSEVMM